jgi:hypothetical protein
MRSNTTTPTADKIKRAPGRSTWQPESIRSRPNAGNSDMAYPGAQFVADAFISQSLRTMP